MDGESFPLRAQLHEQIIQDGVRSDPCLAAGHVRIALRLMPLDVRAHRPKDCRHVAAAKRSVEILHEVHVVHALSSGLSCYTTAGRRFDNVASASGKMPAADSSARYFVSSQRSSVACE